MSEQATAVTTELVRYLAAHTAREDDFLVALKTAAAEAGIPPISIAPEQGTMLQILLRSHQARTVLEIGTLAGYSAITMARALPEDGHLHTMEINDAHADFAQSWIKRSDVANRITIHRANAVELVKTFTDNSIDAAFIDADKSPSMLYLEAAKRIVKPGGLILIDNAFAYGQLLDENPSRNKDDVWAIQRFNDHMAADDSLTSVILPTGDGMWIALNAPAR